MKPFTTSEVATMTGATPRMLAHWAAQGWLSPHLRDVGTGRPRQWTRSDVEQVRRLKAASDLKRTTLAELAS